MLAIIFQPLIDVAEAILRFYHDTIGFGWGGSIVMLTVTVRLAILPLTFKQVRSMQAMQRLQPQMKELQARYKDDRQRMNQELMKLYQEHQVNPLGSCLPLVLQLPFFLSLFYLQQSEGFRALVRDSGAASGIFSVNGSVDAAKAVTGGEQFFFIHDLTVPPTGLTLIALIVTYVATQLGSSTVSAMAMTDKNQKRLMFALPFLFVPFIVNFPAGLLVYWITTNTWTIGQQLLIRKVLPPPHLKEAKEGGAPEGAKAGAGAKGGGDGAVKEKRGLGKILADVAEGGKAAAAERAEARSAAGKTRGGGASAAKGRDGAKGGGGTKSRGGAGAKAGGSKAAGSKRGAAGGGNGAKAEKKSSGEGGNGGSRKAPPPSPRKKKKRSGRRR